MFPGEYTLYGSKRSYFTAKVDNVLRFQLVAVHACRKDGEVATAYGTTLEQDEDVSVWLRSRRDAARIYQELSRLDIRDEILKLAEADLAQVREAIPAGALDAYLAPPLDRALGMEGNKDTFPHPESIGMLND